MKLPPRRERTNYTSTRQFQKFGDLTIISLNDDGHGWWLARCGVCKGETVVSERSLEAGQTACLACTARRKMAAFS